MANDSVAHLVELLRGVDRSYPDFVNGTVVSAVDNDVVDDLIEYIEKNDGKLRSDDVLDEYLRLVGWDGTYL